jgi:hypothetical protein
MPEQTQLQGLANFAGYIKPIMHKVKQIIDYRAGDKVSMQKAFTKQELNSILQFYLETCDYLSKQ